MGLDLQPAYEKLDEKALLYLLTDCLNRAKDSAAGNAYACNQLKQAEQITRVLGIKMEEKQPLVV